MKNVLKRFLEIWKPDFLGKLLRGDNEKTTWIFWFFYNAVITLLISFLIVFTLVRSLNVGIKYLATSYPDAEIIVKSGKLSTSGFNEPIFKEEGDKSVFVLDTKNEKYESSILDKYQSGLFIGADKLYNKKNLVETQTYDISKIGKDFSMTQKDLKNKFDDNRGKLYSLFFIFIFVSVFIFFAGLKLVSAFWWTLIFWVLAMIFKIKGLTFKQTYYAVLNFYFIVLVFQAILLFTNSTFPFSTTLIFLLLFGLNFRKFKDVVAPIASKCQESKMKGE